MHKVIVINLSGNAYQIDEDGYHALRAYLDRAAANLAGNPDRAEILLDLEQAIADKCQRFLSPQKTVVLAAEVEQIVAEMGPVDAGSGDAEAGSDRPDGTKEEPPADSHAPRRLYRIREDAMGTGVCAGLAAYFRLDVTLVRVAFVLLTVFTRGVGILVYFVLTFLLPEARTPEERAAAWQLPFNAKEVVDRVKRNLSDLKDDKEWRHVWRRQHRQWRQAARHAARWPGPWAPPPDAATYALAGAMVPLFGVISAALLVLLVVSIVLLVNTGAVFGWTLPPGVPLWAGILGLVVLYHVAVSPLRAVHRAAPYMHPAASGWFWGGFLWLAFLASVGWFASQHVPEIQQFLDRLPAVWNDLVTRVSAGSPTPR